ncbi:MAG: T9SS type A sorting domain-containing protein [Flavobacteriales bacterium]|nr:T9SS type A sorting domain-containing protein [Flavobacteriales bacterium]
MSLIITTVHAQSIQWMRDAGSTPFSANERGDAVDTDTDGNVYVLGHLAIDSQFSGLAVAAAEDGCLAKYNSAGTVQWVHTFGGPGFVDIQEAAVKVSTFDNAVYVCGSLRTQIANPTVAFEGISFTYAGNSRHAFVAKYDLNGNIQWMHHGGGPGLGAGFNDLDIDDQGRIVLVGTVDGTNDFDGQALTFDGGILARYLPDGTLTDLVQLNDVSAVHQEATAVEVAPGSGNIYVSGAFFDNISLNGFGASAPTFSVYTLKLDDALTCQWLRQGGGNSTAYGSYPRGLAIDAAENSYITGNASGLLVSFGPNSFIGNSDFDDEVFLVMYDTDGTPQWLKRGGSIRNDEAFDIIADAQGNTVITGLLGGNIAFADFDGIQVDIVSQSSHCFIARYDANGLITYAERMGGGSDDVGSGLALANDSTFFLTGTTWGSTPWLNWNYVSCCLDPNLFIAKIHDSFNDLSTAVVEPASGRIGVYPNPCTDELFVAGGSLKGEQVLVLDATGRVVLDRAVWTSGSIDVSALPAGSYSFLMTNASGRRAARFMKQ